MVTLKTRSARGHGGNASPTAPTALRLFRVSPRTGSRDRSIGQAWRALAVFPTGAGKSLCYQLPALRYDGMTLVVSPLIALMKDQIDFLQSHGLAAARLDLTLSAPEARAVTEQMEAGTLKLLYVAPERFNNERFLGLLQRTPIALFAVDEAHCISEWGHNFRPDYLKLAEAARTFKRKRVLALTATATPAVVKDICAAFPDSRRGCDRHGVLPAQFERQHYAGQGRRPGRIAFKRLQKRAPGPTIVYVTLQKTAERVAAALQAAGFPAEAYHAGLDDDARRRSGSLDGVGQRHRRRDDRLRHGH